jgi:hypothetical protein
MRWSLILVVCIFLALVTLLKKTEPFNNNVNIDISKVNKKQRMIQTSGSYTLEPNTNYYFNMNKNNSYLNNNRAREIVDLYFPESAKDGDMIVLIDKSDRFGWGNISYDFNTVLGNSDIRGDLSDKNLFRYRGGYVILIWNNKDKIWESNGYKGNIQNSWNGWYNLIYKGFRLSFVDNSIQTSVYPSYMRIDATQNPVLITYYGGTKSYPINLVLNAEIGDLSEDETELTMPIYPSKLDSLMNMSIPLLKRLKDGTIIDFNNGGGWLKDDRLTLNEIPNDLHDLN